VQNEILKQYDVIITDSSYKVQISSEDRFEEIIGRNIASGELRKSVEIVAATDASVLILGETGTGKELVARAIHNLSLRRQRPLIRVNCAAIPSGLLESELFGHERGAFTGAFARKIGRFDLADGGTLFLDEVGDIPLELQPKLLRGLQEQEFERVGGTETKCVDVRVVAATSRDLPGMVSRNQFRADLYYRLNVFPLRLPPLRERLEDITLLVQHFMDLFAARMKKSVRDIPTAAMESMLRYSWPGNVRELQNFIERAVILSHDTVLSLPLSELQEQVVQESSSLKHVTSRVATARRMTLKEAERECIIQALDAANWVVGGPEGAGTMLGIPRTTLIGKMQRLGISRVRGSKKIELAWGEPKAHGGTRTVK
jgi:formate hydrogenlyase transcriptional activator